MAQRNDIEDVLSSIRRLVADEAGSVAETVAETQTSRALLLDHTQRVTEPEDPFQTVQGMPERADEDEIEEEDMASAPNIDDFEFESRRRPGPRPKPVPPVSEQDEGHAVVEMPITEEDGSATADIVSQSDEIDLSDLSAGIESDEALRDLIAEIVRQELAGALGERITRNVRKLVRRELRQMMSGEEFD